ncbi:MAG TPA: hypothetical protein VJ345_08985, partial [Anaerolineales bacterium]|nr:hypothetical protein [Anaerolineales bacterium]
MKAGTRSGPARRAVLRSDKVRLLTISFLILFLELACIRWLSAYVLYLGYFTNFVLLGALLGIGAGTLLGQRPARWVRWLPALLYSLVALVLITRVQLDPTFEEVIYFTSTTSLIQLPAWLLLPLVFIAVCSIFTLLGQELGRLLLTARPLQAYARNIVGSLVGIAAFTLMSALSLPAWVWFLIAALALIPCLPRDRLFRLNLAFLTTLVLAIAASDLVFHNVWSPYYRLGLVALEQGKVVRVDPRGGRLAADRYVLAANGARHQEFTALPGSQLFYQLPYVAFEPPASYDEVLVVGAGGGNDLAAALAHGVANVDAVEIDPQIVALGRRFHPEHPYDDPRVTIHVDDARSFLEKTDRQYDLIVFALPDSLVLASNLGGLRLESYLFTRESFQSVQRHLKPDGLFVLYNYFRYDWLVDKLGAMVEQVFGERPIYHSYADPDSQQLVFATLFAGPRIRQIDLNQPGFGFPADSSAPPATDDWPFLYLRGPRLPVHYTASLGVILVFSYLYLRRLSPRSLFDRDYWPYFLMGAAFMLLEAKSIVQFLLLFGSTWLVNSLVFFGILLVVLLANGLATRFPFADLGPLYLLLAAALAVNFLLPLDRLLIEPRILRYLAAVALLFSPIFFANLIYSRLFRDTAQANLAFGANVLGAMLGGSM